MRSSRVSSFPAALTCTSSLLPAMVIMDASYSVVGSVLCLSSPSDSPACPVFGKRPCIRTGRKR